jgi:cell fate regulator YaaT (PSP1 superfamily)
MTKQEAINKTIKVLDQLPIEKIQEINDFAGFVLKKLEDQNLLHGIQKLVEKGKPYEFLKGEEDIYTVEDLKERYK